MAVKMLKPRIGTAKVSTLHVLSANPNATPRMRGRKLMERRARWLREHPLCVACEEVGRVAAAAEVDHRTPLWAGGADDESNFQGLCVPCHADKTAAEARRRGRAY